jgi:hypothetical protein
MHLLPRNSNQNIPLEILKLADTYSSQLFRAAGRYQIEIGMTNFVNRQPIIGKPAIFDRSIRFKHWCAIYLFIMILIIYKFFEEKMIMAQVLL